MGISSALWSGVSGLQSNATAMTVIGNNIANSNTTGFKAGKVNFADVLSSDIASGADMAQVGRGSKVSNITSIQAQGSFESTESVTDIALEGLGFFIVNDGQKDYFTRAGSFNFDKQGFLTNPQGLRLQGWQTDSLGNLLGSIGDMNLANVQATPNATTSTTIYANLDAVAPYIPQTVANTTGLITGVTVANGAGNAIGNGTLAYDGAGNLTWTPNGGFVGVAVDVSAGGAYTLYDSTGEQSLTVSVTAALLPGGAQNDTISVADNFDLASPSTTSNFATGVTVYDTLGNAHTVVVYFSKFRENEWAWNATVDGGELSGGTVGTLNLLGSGTIDFTTGGALNTETTTLAFTADFAGGAAPNQAITFDFGDSIGTDGGTGLAGTTQFSAQSAVAFLDQDGFSAGALSSISIAQDGLITGFFTNGQTEPLAMISVANFQNFDGLKKAGNNLFEETFLSGQPVISTADSGGRGKIQSNSLEQSNVDIAKEFVNMITTQRAFQANSRTITTTDDMLAEIINIKR